MLEKRDIQKNGSIQSPALSRIKLLNIEIIFWNKKVLDNENPLLKYFNGNFLYYNVKNFELVWTSFWWFSRCNHKMVKAHSNNCSSRWTVASNFKARFNQLLVEATTPPKFFSNYYKIFNTVVNMRFYFL